MQPVCPRAGPAGARRARAKLGTGVPSRRADLRTGVLRSSGRRQAPRRGPSAHGNCSARGGNEGTAVPMWHRMKAESTFPSGRLMTGTTVAETDRRVSARREACPGRQNEPPPARSLPGFSRTGFGAGAVPTSRRTRRLRLAALRAWGARDADATVLRLHRNDHVGAAPVDLDVVAAIAALTDVLG